MKRIFSFLVLSFILSSSVFAGDAYITGSIKNPTNENEIQVNFYDHGQYDDCEEMAGFWVTPNHPDGVKLIKKMKREASEMGATHILFNMGDSVFFYCSEKN